MKNIVELGTQLVQFLLKEKKWWLIPILVILVLVGGLFLLTQGSAIAPFIYTMF